MTISAVRLNHAVLFVSDLERALEFYTAASRIVAMSFCEPRSW